MAVDETRGVSQPQPRRVTAPGTEGVRPTAQPPADTTPPVPADGVAAGDKPAAPTVSHSDIVAAATGPALPEWDWTVPSQPGDWSKVDFAALLAKYNVDGLVLDGLTAGVRVQFHPELDGGASTSMPLAVSPISIFSSHDDIPPSMYAPRTERPLHASLLPQVRWSGWDDLMAGPAARKPLEVKAPPLADVQAAGLHPGGDYFAMPPLEDGKHNAWCDKVAVEKALLADPKVVSDMQGQVLSALARLGPLSQRQLIRATGLSGDMLGALLHRPYSYSSADEVANSLFSTHSGVLTEKNGKYQLSQPNDMSSRQRQAVATAHGHVDEALAQLDSAHEVLQLAAPLLRGINAGAADVLDPQGSTRGQAPDAHAAYEKLKGMELIDKGQSEQQWLAEWSKDPQAARAYWLDVGTSLASRVAYPLERITGFEKLMKEMQGPHVAIPEPATRAFVQGLRDGFGHLAHTDTASVMNAFYVHGLGSETPHVGEGVAELSGTLAAVDPDKARTASRQALEALAAAVEGEASRLGAFSDNRVPSRPSIDEGRAQRESGLQSPQQWGQYLDKEYPIPSKVLERLQQMQAQGRTDAVAVAGEVPFNDLSPRVGEVARQFMQATLRGDESAREQAVHRFLELKRQGALGTAEFGDTVVPRTYVRLGSSGCGGGPDERYIDKPYYVGKSRDAESLRELMGMSTDTYEGARRLSDTSSAVRPAHDTLFEDVAVARSLGQTERAQALRHEAMTLYVESKAHAVAYRDPLLADSPGSMMMGGAGFEFMDLSRAGDMVGQALRARAWARQQDLTFPLSPANAQLACKAPFPTWSEVNDADRRSLDCGKLAAYTLDNRSSYIPPERLNEFFSSTAASA